jgi:hypothetical protein
MASWSEPNSEFREILPENVPHIPYEVEWVDESDDLATDPVHSVGALFFALFLGLVVGFVLAQIGQAWGKGLG